MPPKKKLLDLTSTQDTVNHLRKSYQLRNEVRNLSIREGRFRRLIRWIGQELFLGILIPLRIVLVCVFNLAAIPIALWLWIWFLIWFLNI